VINNKRLYVLYCWS